MKPETPYTGIKDRAGTSSDQLLQGGRAEGNWVEYTFHPVSSEAMFMEGLRGWFARASAPFHRLRWKLTSSYMLVTVGAILVIELVILLLSSHYIARQSLVRPGFLFQELEVHHVPAASAFLSETPPDIMGLRASLRDQDEIAIETQPIALGNFLFSAYSTNLLSVAYLGANGVLIDSIPHDFIQGPATGNPFDVSTVPGLEEPLEAALRGKTDHRELYANSGRNRMVGALPIFDELGKGKVVGALVFVQKLEFWEVWTFPQFARVMGVSLLFVTAFAAAMGIIFGSQTSRMLVKRLQQTLRATQSWSRGEFSAHVDDETQDELGALARGLNRMAAQLENLIEEKREQSVVGERMRLARDLHDSVKQRAFAASAQLAAARTHLNSDPHKACIHLTETDRLLDGMRQELSSLIYELRPPSMRGRGLQKALREFAQDCKSHSGIDIEVYVKGERWLPLEMEQGLFRVAQGALSNVVRHSRATRAEVHLTYDERTVTLSIIDNGCGFKVSERCSGLGLRLMRERAQMLKGNLMLRSDPAEGTEVRLKCGIEKTSPEVVRG